LLHDLDLRLLHLINDLAGQHWTLDRMVANEEMLALLKGGVLLGLYWMSWFRRGGDQQDRKATIVAAMAGALVALLVARTLAAALPFRERPIYALSGAIRLPSYPIQPDLEDWSAFPSDTATYFVALAFGFWFLWRPLGAILLVWVLAYICLPRVFLAVHYPSDILAGAVIGILSAMLLQRSALKSWIARPTLAFEHARPDLFYPLMFLVSYELVVVFADIRIPLRAVTHALHHYGLLTSANLSLVAVWVCVLAVAFLVLIAVHYRRKPRHAGPTAQERVPNRPLIGTKFAPSRDAAE
jgi:undecaprenyl-diphosphatase